MAQSHHDCSIRQGFNFVKDEQVLVGHLVSISIGGTALSADITLTLPTDYKTAAVVAPISTIHWDGGYADPIHILCNVSTKNQTAVSLLTHTDLSKTDVEFAFNIYAFDQVNKVYYLCFHTDSVVMKGLVLKNGGDLALSIENDPDMTVPSPLNYSMQIGIMPQQIAQDIKLAVSNTDKFVKKWGVTVS